MNEFAETRFVKLMRGAPRHRKFRRLARALGVTQFEALGITVALWDFCDECFPFGVLSGLDAEDICDALHITSIDPDELIAALVDARLVDWLDGDLAIHGWLKEGRSGASAKKRSALASRAAHERWHRDQPNVDCDLCNQGAAQESGHQRY